MIAEAAEAANVGTVRAPTLAVRLSAGAPHGHGFAAAQVSSVPGIATAPGPGKSWDASTVALKEGGMENTVTSVAAAAPRSSSARTA